MPNPGSFKQVDTNKWENQVTGDTVSIKKVTPAHGGSRSWRLYVNGERVENMSSRVKKSGAEKRAKKKMETLTVKEQKKKLKRKKKLKKALESALETYDSRSPRARRMDQNRFNQIHYNLSDAEEVERWAKDPGSGDLDIIDSPIGGDESMRKQIERRIESVEKSIRKTEKKIK